MFAIVSINQKQNAIIIAHKWWLVIGVVGFKKVRFWIGPKLFLDLLKSFFFLIILIAVQFVVIVEVVVVDISSSSRDRYISSIRVESRGKLDRKRA